MSSASNGVSWPASVGRAFEAIADRWTISILREAFIGPRRFDELQRSLDISRHTLTRRLTELVERQLLEKHEYQVSPVRSEYVLTERGEELYGIFVVVKRWGDKWLGDENDAAVYLWHRTCGRQIEGRVVCESCGEELRPSDMDYAVKSPGAPAPRRRSKKGGAGAKRIPNSPS